MSWRRSRRSKMWVLDWGVRVLGPGSRVLRSLPEHPMCYWVGNEFGLLYGFGEINAFKMTLSRGYLGVGNEKLIKLIWNRIC